MADTSDEMNGGCSAHGRWLHVEAEIAVVAIVQGGASVKFLCGPDAVIPISSEGTMDFDRAASEASSWFDAKKRDRGDPARALDRHVQIAAKYAFHAVLKETKKNVSLDDGPQDPPPGQDLPDAFVEVALGDVSCVTGLRVKIEEAP